LACLSKLDRSPLFLFGAFLSVALEKVIYIIVEQYKIFEMTNPTMASSFLATNRKKGLAGYSQNFLRSLLVE
jgi:hypothetical protein